VALRVSSNPYRRYPVGTQSGSGAPFDMLRRLDSVYHFGKPKEEIKWFRDVIGRFASRVVPPCLFSTKKSREGFAELAKFGRYHPQLSDAVHLARAFPDTTIILNHVGHVLGVGPSAVHHQEILAAWRKDTNEFAKCPNVCVKLGGIGMTSFGFDFHKR
jgi:L-fuconolactonase